MPRAGWHIACALLLLLLPEAGAFTGSFLPAQRSRVAATTAGVSMALSPDGFRGSILVVGATGLVGGEVARLLAEHGIATHALARDAGRARQILPAGVNILRGDLGDQESLLAALRTSGAERMFVATHRPASAKGPTQAELEGNAYRAAALEGVQYIVKLSTAPAVVGSPGTGVGSVHSLSEDALKECGVSWTSLRSNYFLQNVLRPGLAVGPGYTPKLLAESPAKIRSWFADSPISMVDSRDVALAAATLLCSSPEELAPHLSQTPSLTGPRAVTMKQVGVAFGGASGREVRVEGADIDAGMQALAKAGVLPAPAAESLAAFLQVVGRECAEVTDTLEALTGTPPRTLEAFAKDYADQP
ncbi:hypothetical protein T484DRAFT_1927572 [Baffinella frigidus]|nr:hypothetical protein T484DRAFT_1927572 [Cryptophyta sp. CCMP2293]